MRIRIHPNATQNATEMRWTSKVLVFLPSITSLASRKKKAQELKTELGPRVKKLCTALRNRHDLGAPCARLLFTETRPLRSHKRASAYAQ